MTEIDVIMPIDGLVIAASLIGLFFLLMAVKVIPTQIKPRVTNTLSTFGQAVSFIIAGICALLIISYLFTLEMIEKVEEARQQPTTSLAMAYLFTDFISYATPYDLGDGLTMDCCNFEKDHIECVMSGPSELNDRAFIKAKGKEDFIDFFCENPDLHEGLEAGIIMQYAYEIENEGMMTWRYNTDDCKRFLRESQS